MPTENKVFIEIVLDDGSVQKGFAKIKTQGKETADQLNENFGKKDIFGSEKLVNFNAILGETGSQVSSLISGMGKFGLVAAGLAAVGFGVKKAFDLTLEGEKINQINNQFEVLASRAGFAAEGMRAALESAAGGLADTEKILAVANIALGEMGANASKLPELLGVARQAAIKFGGDAGDRFQELSQAILSTNTKSLKQLGIFIDVNKVVEDFAKANGRAADEVTQLGKQQALMDAILKESQNTFAGLDESQSAATVGSRRLSVAMGEIGDSFALLSQSAFGSFFGQVANGLADFAMWATGFGPQFQSQVRKIDEEMSALNEKLLSQQERAMENAAVLAQEEAGERGFFGQLLYGTVDPAFLNSKVEQTMSMIDALKKQKADLIKASTGGDKGALFDEVKRQQESLKNTEKYNQELQKLELDNLSKQSALAAFGKDLKEQEQLALAASKMQFLIADAKLEADFHAKRGITAQQFQMINKQNETNYQLEIQRIQAEFRMKREKDEQDHANKIKQINQLAQNALLSVISQTMQRIGANLKEGASAWDSFKGMVLNIIGDMAIQIGTTLVGIGIGIENLKLALATLSGGTAIAAGLALIAIGGLLKSMGSEGLSNAPTSGTGFSNEGGIIGADPGSDVGSAQPTREANTSVVVNIQGDVLDSDESGIRVVGIINDAFDKKGVTIRRGVIA